MGVDAAIAGGRSSCRFPAVGSKMGPRVRDLTQGAGELPRTSLQPRPPLGPASQDGPHTLPAVSPLGNNFFKKILSFGIVFSSQKSCT